MEDMPLVGLRQFRERIDTFKEPVRVVKTRGDITVLGIWIPEGSPYVAKLHITEDALRRKVSSSQD